MIIMILLYQVVEIPFHTKYDELKSDVWLLNFYLTIRHVSTLLRVFISEIS